MWAVLLGWQDHRSAATLSVMRRTLVVAGLVIAQLFATTAWAGKRRPEERMDVADVLTAGDGNTSSS